MSDDENLLKRKRPVFIDPILAPFIRPMGFASSLPPSIIIIINMISGFIEQEHITSRVVWAVRASKLLYCTHTQIGGDFGEMKFQPLDRFLVRRRGVRQGRERGDQSVAPL